jgi:hypothetical protein
MKEYLDFMTDIQSRFNTNKDFYENGFGKSSLDYEAIKNKLINDDLTAKITDEMLNQSEEERLKLLKTKEERKEDKKNKRNNSKEI